MLCSSFLFTCSGAFGYHFGGLNEVPIGVMECRDRDRTGVRGILDDADEDIGRRVQPELARSRPRSALTNEAQPTRPLAGRVGCSALVDEMPFPYRAVLRMLNRADVIKTKLP